jgi:hypothetical protein
VPEGPHEELVQRLHRAIAAFGAASGVETPVVEIELIDTTRFVLEKIEPEPGFGMVTVYIRSADEDDPDALIIPIGSIRRIELRKTPEERVASVGFSVPKN